jgi:hypothetical protein
VLGTGICRMDLPTLFFFLNLDKLDFFFFWLAYLYLDIFAVVDLVSK